MMAVTNSPSRKGRHATRKYHQGIRMDFWPFREAINTWTHLIWMILAMPGTVILWQRSRGDRPKQFSMLVFGLTLIACFGGSSLFHALRLPEDRLQPYITLDYVGIYLLIAGTGTVITFNLLSGGWKWGILGSVWLAAIAGITSRLFAFSIPTWFSTVLYLTMGWGLISCYPELAKALSHRALRLVVLGGLLYSVGALVYVFNWPALWPGVINSHELLHICTMAASLTHYCFVFKYVTPYERRANRAEEAPYPGTLTPGQTMT